MGFNNIFVGLLLVAISCGVVTARPGGYGSSYGGGGFLSYPITYSSYSYPSFGGFGRGYSAYSYPSSYGSGYSGYGLGWRGSY